MEYIFAFSLRAFHFAWILFNITGFFWALRWPVLGKIHAATLGVTVSFFIFLGYCPVTVWEWQLRQSAGEDVLSGGFITQWLGKLISIHVSGKFIGYVTIGLFLLSFWLHVLRPWWLSHNTKNNK